MKTTYARGKFTVTAQTVVLLDVFKLKGRCPTTSHNNNINATKVTFPDRQYVLTHTKISIPRRTIFDYQKNQHTKNQHRKLNT